MEEKTGAVIYAPVYVKSYMFHFSGGFCFFYGQIALADFASTTRFNAINKRPYGVWYAFPVSDPIRIQRPRP